MKNTNKKGFTIVELVIVIAVIAILAAVLIPTFVGLVNKANQAADQVAVRNMNTALASAGDFDATDINAVVDALANAGFNSKKALIPVTSGHTFYWYATAKQVVLVNDNNEVVFPEGVAYDANGTSLEGSSIYIDVVAGNKETFIDAIDNKNLDITLSDNISLDERVVINNTVDFDLNGKTITSTLNEAGSASGQAALTFGDEAVINGNGKIENTAGKYAINIVNMAGDSKTVTINDGTYIASTSAVNVWQGHVVINGGHFEVYGTPENGYKFLLNILDTKRDTSSITVKGGTFVNFNPADNAAEGAGTNFVADGYSVASKDVDGDTWYTVYTGSCPEGYTEWVAE